MSSAFSTYVASPTRRTDPTRERLIGDEMLRSNSDRKWKQVLGFDDGSFAGPPVYSDLPEVVTEPVLATMPTYSRLPRDITFYRKRGGDVVLSASPPAPSPNDLKPLPSPPPLFYITIEDDPSPFEVTHKPDIRLHTGPSKSSPIFSYVEFQPASQKADITICTSSSISSTHRTISFPSSPSSLNSPTSWTDSSNSNLPKPRTERLSPTGSLFSAERFSFSHTLPNSFVRERFEWRYSTGPFIRTSSGTKESGGLKLVRVSTGDTVAVYAGLGAPPKYSTRTKVLGMFRFLGGADLVNLGAEFEILAVMSILAVVERNRRAVVVQKATFGIRQ